MTLPSQQDPNPGIYYDVPDEYYFGINAISFHRMLNADPGTGGCPLKYYIAVIRGEDNIEETSAMRVGKLANDMLLRPEQLNSKYAVRPEEIDGKPWHGNRKECKQWMADAEQAALCIVSTSEWSESKRLSESVASNLMAAELVQKSDHEVVIVWQCSVTGLICKAKIDMIMKGKSGYREISDLKTTSKELSEFMRRELWTRQYDRQLAFYRHGMACLGHPEMDVSLLAVEKCLPYRSAIVCLHHIDLAAAHEENNTVMLLLKECYRDNVWPSYLGDQVMASRPKYLVRDFALEDVL